MSSRWNDPFDIMKWPLSQKSTLSDINIATLAFFWHVLSFHLFNFNLPMSLYLKCISYKQNIFLVFYLIGQSVFFTQVFRLTFKLIIYMVRFESIILLFVPYVPSMFHLFFAPIFLVMPSFGLIDNFAWFYFRSLVGILGITLCFIILVVILGLLLVPYCLQVILYHFTYHLRTYSYILLLPSSGFYALFVIYYTYTYMISQIRSCYNY